jgi:putative ABC transport system substrate-binding protein
LIKKQYRRAKKSSAGNVSPAVTEAYRHAGLYVGRILRGAKPSDLPVGRLTKFEFVINLTTAKALGLNIPASFLSLADDLIE